MHLAPIHTPASLARLSDEFNKMLANFPSWAGENDDHSVVISDWTPAVDIKEEDNKFLITADLPGVDPKDVDISMHNGVLSIQGARREETKEEKDGYRRVERFDGSFYRRFMLPETADAENISARAKNGVLEIEIAKTKAVEAKKIKIES